MSFAAGLDGVGQHVPLCHTFDSYCSAMVASVTMVTVISGAWCRQRKRARCAALEVGSTGTLSRAQK
jgi:hypothetical protein